MDAQDCLNCGAALHGEYCSHCGQPAHEGREPSVRHFLHDLTHEFLHVDGRIAGPLKATSGQRLRRTIRAGGSVRFRV